MGSSRIETGGDLIPGGWAGRLTADDDMGRKKLRRGTPATAAEGTLAAIAELLGSLCTGIENPPENSSTLEVAIGNAAFFGSF